MRRLAGRVGVARLERESYLTGEPSREAHRANLGGRALDFEPASLDGCRKLAIAAADCEVEALQAGWGHGYGLTAGGDLERHLRQEVFRRGFQHLGDEGSTSSER